MGGSSCVSRLRWRSEYSDCDGEGEGEGEGASFRPRNGVRLRRLTKSRTLVARGLGEAVDVKAVLLFKCEARWKELVEEGREVVMTASATATVTVTAGETQRRCALNCTRTETILLFSPCQL